MHTTIYRFIIPYLYLPDYMKQYGYEVSVSAVLISAIGIAQTVGMIGLGYLGDRSWMNINICYSICMLGKKELFKEYSKAHLISSYLSYSLWCLGVLYANSDHQL